jgi:hypothetical protein
MLQEWGRVNVGCFRAVESRSRMSRFLTGLRPIRNDRALHIHLKAGNSKKYTNVGPGASFQGGKAGRARARTFSQAPQAVRSARGRRWHGVFPTSACASRTLDPDKRDTLGLTTVVQGLGNISGTAAARAVLRIHSSPSIGKSVSLKLLRTRKK